MAVQYERSVRAGSMQGSKPVVQQRVQAGSIESSDFASLRDQSAAAFWSPPSCPGLSARKGHTAMRPKTTQERFLAQAHAAIVVLERLRKLVVRHLLVERHTLARKRAQIKDAKGQVDGHANMQTGNSARQTQPSGCARGISSCSTCLACF